LERITKSTGKVIDFLKAHPAIEDVIFPLDKDFPQYHLATKQMSGGCGLLTIVLKANSMEAITRFCESFEHIRMAVSWGGHESLALPKAAGIEPADFDKTNIEHRYIRLYVGLEEPEYLIADLEKALATVK
jgi:cystathionine beta-lyase/cystathionine gamma-synthase